MKKRIIAVFIAFCVLVGGLSITKRASAAAAVAPYIASFFVLAWELIDIMRTGQEPGIIIMIRNGLEDTWDFFTDPDSPSRKELAYLWDEYGQAFDGVYDKVVTMYNSGDLTIKNGQLQLTYDQYKQLYDIAYSFLPNVGVEFTTPNYYFAFAYTPGSFLPYLGLPVNDLYYKSTGQSYALIYYNDTKVVFSDHFAYLRDSNDRYYGGGLALDSSFDSYSFGFYFQNLNYDEMNHCNFQFGYSSLSSFDRKNYPLNSSKLLERNYTTSFCFVFENGAMTRQAISSVDLTGCSTAIVSTGSYGDFLQSITSVDVTDPVAAELDDLSNILPVDKNPVLSIPTVPDLTKPIADQVTVSVPDAADSPLSDYMDPLLTDIRVPNIIWTKFPFCIPYDFVRFLGFLAADPIAPVFRIPISTHPKNLEQWAGNETVGGLVAPDDPMFDIDEEIVIDLSNIPLVQPICYTVFIVGFVIALIKLTPKLIQH